MPSQPWIGTRKFADRRLAFTWHGVTFRRPDCKRDKWAIDVLDKWDADQDAVYIVSGRGRKFPDTQSTITKGKASYVVMEAQYSRLDLRRPNSRSGMVVLRNVA